LLLPDAERLPAVGLCKNFSRVRKMDEHRLMALDWGTVLRSRAARYRRTAPSSACARLIFKRRRGPAENNLLCCRVDRVVEDMFSIVAMLNTPGGGEGVFPDCAWKWKCRRWQAWTCGRALGPHSPRRYYVLKS
jgi:molybdate transport system ATP-binding protein